MSERPTDDTEQTPEQTPAASPPATADATLAGLRDGLHELARRFEARLAYDTTKEAAFQHLYADLREARLAASLEATRPLLVDLLLLYDRVVAARRSTEHDGERSALASLGDELLEILQRRDVRLVVSVAERFDPDTQQVVGVTETSEPEDHLRVERIVRPGFRWGARVLRAEEVVVRRHRRAAAPVVDGGAP